MVRIEKYNFSTLKDHLSYLAQKYETTDFLQGDPSWFMHEVIGNQNQETMAFIASCLSYGSRKVFMPRIQYLLDCSHCEPYDWIKTGRFALDIPNNDECFYRLYSNGMIYDLLRALQSMLLGYGSMKDYILSYARSKESKLDTLMAIEAICSFFDAAGVRGIVPKNTSSCCKRVCMFLRWMVRSNSPVDLGLWSDIIDRRTLIMPLDTHVIQESLQLGLLEHKTASMSAAIKLSNRLAEFFPDDPLKGDFALFGHGIDK